jgi:hypothetical protein
MRTTIPSLPPMLQRFSVQRMASRTPWSCWICDRSEPVPNSICSHCKSFGAHAAGRRRRLEHRHRQTWHSGYVLFGTLFCLRQPAETVSSVVRCRPMTFVDVREIGTPFPNLGSLVNVLLGYSAETGRRSHAIDDAALLTVQEYIAAFR